MSHQYSLPELLSRALAPSNRGVLGLVDDLLILAREHDFQLAWQAGRCRVDFLDQGAPGRIEMPLPKSVIRAALARIAVLCNERNPSSVSPHGGQGEVVVEAGTAKTIRVTFVNTPEKQSLGLATAKPGMDLPIGEQTLSAIV